MDSDSIAPIIYAITGLLTAIGVLYNIIISKRVEHSTNGLTKQLGEAKQQLGQAEGHAEGLEKGKAEGEAIGLKKGRKEKS